MEESNPKETTHIAQESAIATVSNESSNFKESLKASSSSQAQQMLHKSSNNNLRMMIEEKRNKLYQKKKRQLKQKMREEIRQEVIREVQPKLRRQYQKRVSEIFDVTKEMMATHLHNWSLLQEQPQVNPFKDSQQHVKSMQPQEEQQQNIVFESRRGSPDRERSFDSKRYFASDCRSRHRKNRLCSPNSSDSSGSSDSKIDKQFQAIRKYVQIGITGAVRYYHKQLVKAGRLLPKP